VACWSGRYILNACWRFVICAYWFTLCTVVHHAVCGRVASRTGCRKNFPSYHALILKLSIIFTLIYPFLGRIVGAGGHPSFRCICSVVITM
jgi:hypothetical protein